MKDSVKKITLIGLAGSGKSTVARYLRAEQGFQTYAFAAPIKTMIAGAFRLNPDQLEGAEKETPIPRLGRSPRYLMQTLGTEWGRDLVHPDVWLFCAERWLRDARKDHERRHRGMPLRVVFSDVRFETEAAWLLGQGGIIAHVVGWSGRVDEQASEAGVQGVDGDWRIDNDGSLEDLKGLVDDMLACLDFVDYCDAFC